jgi:D-aminopeptidase
MNHKNKRRFRDLTTPFGLLAPGERNSITDVNGITVGHQTIQEGERVRTGVTVIDPGIRQLFTSKLPVAISVGNGFGKLAGYTQVEELGTLETPIALTNTLAVGPVLQGLIELTLGREDISLPTTINGVVGETNDGIVNDIHTIRVKPSDVTIAYENCSEVVGEGCVGAGTGTRCYSWKGGIGTSSRVITIEGKQYTVGVLLQTNFGGALTILGQPVHESLQQNDFKLPPHDDGSCMIIVATDAPLDARQLRRVASRSFLGLARTGSVLAHGSGDYAIAFSTNRTGLVSESGVCVADDHLNQFFLAATEATEECVYNALCAAETTYGRDGNVLERLPIEELI